MKNHLFLLVAILFASQIEIGTADFCSDGLVYRYSNWCKDICDSQTCLPFLLGGCYCPETHCRRNGVCVPRVTTTTTTTPAPTARTRPCRRGLVYRYSNMCEDICGSSVCLPIKIGGCYCPETHCRLNGFCVPRVYPTTPTTTPTTRVTYHSCPNGFVYRMSNPCVDTCGYEICPQYIAAGCYCPPDKCNQNGVCVSRDPTSTTTDSTPPPTTPPTTTPTPVICTFCLGREVYRESNPCLNTCGAEFCPQYLEWGCYCPIGECQINGECFPITTSPVLITTEPIPVCDVGFVYRESNPCVDSCESEICPLYITPGCYCPPGLCNLNGVCIPDERTLTTTLSATVTTPTEPHNTCPPGFVFRESNLCVDTCGAEMCLQYVQWGCFCPPGQCQINGECFPGTTTSEVTSSTEPYNTCLPGFVYRQSNTCVNTCGAEICLQYIEWGCFCPPGQCQINGECFPITTTSEVTSSTEPSPVCGDGFVYSESNPCIDSCESEICPLYVTPGCYCPQHLCNLNGGCIPDERTLTTTPKTTIITTPTDPLCFHYGPGFVYRESNPCINTCGAEICPQYLEWGCYCPIGYCQINGECFPITTTSEVTSSTEPSLACDIGFVCRESNECIDNCESDFCPQYLVFGCFCPPGQCNMNGVCITRGKIPTTTPPTTIEEPQCTTCPPGFIHRDSNACVDKCGSEICPQYIVPGCYCPPDQCNLDGYCVPREPPTTPEPTTTTELIGTTEACRDGLELRYSNPCLDNCESEVCPLYAEYACFCPAGQCSLNGVCVPRNNAVLD